MRLAPLVVLSVTAIAAPPAFADTAIPGVKPPPLDAGPVAPSQPRLPPTPRSGGARVASGSGFVVARGRVLTNQHVVASCMRLTARNTRGQRAPAQIEAADAKRDLAILTVPAQFGPALAFRDSPPVVRGEQVVTYGFPLAGLLSSGPTLTVGDISALTGLRDDPTHYTISAPVQPGNSGGPLMDAQAHVVGVIVSKLNAARVARMTGGDIPQNVNFAIKGAEALAFLAERGVVPPVASSDGVDRKPAEVGQIAHASVAFIQCYR